MVMSVEARMKALLDSLDYDFSRFTMDDFIDWVQAYKGRRISFIPWDMPPGMFGVWMSDADEAVEHVFIDKNTPPLHKVHIQLHELGHIVCDHPTARLTKAEMQTLLLQAVENPDILSEVLLRAPAKKEMEQEAEMLAALIQHQVIAHKRMQQLSIAASSNESVIDHLESLGLA
jgi:hypothetical protein